MANNSSDFQRNIINEQDVVILNGQTTSNSFRTHGTALAGLYLPSNFDGANITFLVAPHLDSANFFDLVDFETGLAFSASVNIGAASQGQAYVELPPNKFYDLVHFKIVSDVAQVSGDANIKVSSFPL